MKNIVNIPAIEKLRHNIYSKLLQNVDMDVWRKVSINVYANGEIERVVNIESGILDFFSSLNKD